MMRFEIKRYGRPNADTLLFQMVDEHDLEVIEQEVSYIRERSGGQDFCLTAVKVNDWNKDLSPWPAPAVFGNEDFGDGAAETLEYLLNEVVPDTDMSVSSGQRLFIGGYSLAGLFALWAGYQTDRFDGIAAASPSIWFPSFTDYMRENQIRADAVYLSLGDREERTKNPVMTAPDLRSGEPRGFERFKGIRKDSYISQVGNAIRDAEIILRDAGTGYILEWN